jgi:methyl-accepting chemotaxis protein
MKNLKIRTKLLLSFAIVTLIAIIIGLVGYTNIKTIDNADTRMYQEVVMGMEDLSYISTNFQKMNVIASSN